MNYKYSVDFALRLGHILITVPCIFIFGFCIYFFINQPILIFQSTFANYTLSLFLSIAAFWLFWSISIVPWKVWAYSNVRNVHELKKRAVFTGLIKNDGHLITDTEINLFYSKNTMNEIEKRFLESDTFIFDPKIPDKYEIYTQKVYIKLIIFVNIISLFFIVYTFITQIFEFIELLMILVMLAFYNIWNFFKLQESPNLLFTLNDQGISSKKHGDFQWELIEYEGISRKGDGKNTRFEITFLYREELISIPLEGIDLGVNKLYKLLFYYKYKSYNSKR